MKKLFLSAFTAFLIMSVSPLLMAQDNPEDLPTMNKRTAVNFYGGLLAEPSLINKHVGFSMGAQMGITLFDHYYIGGYYMSLVTEHFRYDINDHLNSKLRGSLDHGGLILGYIWKPQGLMNINFNARTGWGSIWYYDPNEKNGDILNDLYRGTRDYIIALTPGIEYMITPITWMRIGVGMGYRFLFNLDQYSHYDYDGPVGSISFTFGNFRDKTPEQPDVNTEP